MQKDGRFVKGQGFLATCRTNIDIPLLVLIHF